MYRTAIKAKQKACRNDLCAFVFYQKPPMAAKRRSLRLPKILFSPLKTSGLRSAQPKKKERKCAQISRKVRSWWNFTTPLEPILRKNAEPSQAPPPSGQVCPLRPAQKTLCIFFAISPRRDFFNLEKGVSGRVAFRQKPKQAACLGRQCRPRFAQSETEENLL